MKKRKEKENRTTRYGELEKRIFRSLKIILFIFIFTKIMCKRYI